MLRVYVNKVFSLFLAILIAHSCCFSIVSFSSSGDSSKVILAAFNNNAYEGISQTKNFMALSDVTTYNNASTSLEWTLNANNFNVDISGNELHTYENGGMFHIRFKGTSGTNFNIVYQKMANATGTNTYKVKTTANGEWQVTTVEFSKVSGFYDDGTFAVKFDCGGWGIAAGTDYTVNDKIYIDSIWFEPAFVGGGSDSDTDSDGDGGINSDGTSDEVPSEGFICRENEPGLMYIADFNKPDSDSHLISGSGFVCQDTVYEGSTYSLEWVLDRYIDIDLPSGIDWNDYDNVNIRFCSEVQNQSINMVFIAPEQYTSGQIYRLFPTTSGAWEELTVPVSKLKNLFMYSLNGKSMGVLRFDASGWSNTSYTEGSSLYIDSVYLTKNEYGTYMNEPTSNIDGHNVVIPDIDGNNTLNFKFDTTLYDQIDKNFVQVFKDEIAIGDDEYEVSVDSKYLNIRFDDRLNLDSSYKVILSAEVIRSANGAALENDVIREFTVGYEYGWVYFDKPHLISGDTLTATIEASADADAYFTYYDLESNVIGSEERFTFKNIGIITKTYTVPANCKYANVCIKDANGALVYLSRLDSEGKKNAVIINEKAEVTSLDVSLDSYGCLSINAVITQKNAPVLITVKDSLDNICHSDAAMSSDGGAVTYQYTYGTGYESGEYTVSVKFGNHEKSDEVHYVSGEDSLDFLYVANSGNSSVISGWMLANRGVISHLFDNEAKIDDAAVIIAENIPYIDFEALDNMLKKISKSIETINSKIWSDIGKYIHDNNAFLLFGAHEYAYFKNLTISKQNDICTNIVRYAPFSTVSEFREVFIREVKNYIEQIENNSGVGDSSPSQITSSTSVSQGTPLFQPETGESSAPFNDLFGYEWAETSINELCDMGVISKSADKRFRPGDYVTREEFVKLIIQALYFDSDFTVHRFTDEEAGAWYNEYLSRAFYLGIVHGREDGSFGVGETITREDMVTIICRTLEKIGCKLNYNATCDFKDSSEISEYAFMYVCALTESGIVNGMGNGNFAPADYANRAQAAKVILSVLTYIKEAGYEY